MEKTQTNYLEEVATRFRKEKEINEKVVHQAKLLLTHYRHVVWSVEHDLYDLDLTANEFGSRRIQDLINYLAFDFEDEINKDKVGDHLKSIANTSDLVILVDKALCRLKTYPGQGDLYFNLINRKYIIKYEYTDQELMESLAIERTTYYKRKKEAINLLGTILWGYVLPEMRKVCREVYLLCADNESHT